MPEIAQEISLGVVPWSQAATWPEMLAVAELVDGLGYEHLWTWDHLLAIYGDPDQPIFEGWSTVAAWAMVTQRVRIGLLVDANTTRNPGIVAKSAVTLDHISAGRAILGLGAGWHGLEHRAFGIDFGASVGQRLDWMDEAAAAIRPLLDGETVSSAPGGHYAFDALRHAPGPLQGHLPIMIGGGGEKKTLRTVARYADMWNVSGTPAQLAHKADVLGEHCLAVGRDIAGIEFSISVTLAIRDTAAEAESVMRTAIAHNRTPWSRVADDAAFMSGSPAEIADRLRPYVELGFRTILAEQPAPFDVETLERFIGEVKPLLA
ncbi:MAG TPA: LLM class flavin-dependent oxidoreductase [Candidatus Limnocylindrales bacterium]|jgi:alkanesulfonate monooxygenase SsuD/methylene tetrahydromethanopterin reductase-like flavin-dependent oxidoreductase (luciferase family)